MLIQHLDKTRHMHAFEVMRQVYIHVEHGHCMLNNASLVHYPYRMADCPDPRFVDGNASRIGYTLHICNERFVHCVPLQGRASHIEGMRCKSERFTSGISLLRSVRYLPYPARTRSTSERGRPGRGKCPAGPAAIPELRDLGQIAIPEPRCLRRP